ncbi:MAG TPA: hypothetical protein VGO92_10350 [Acidimicrobiales bacterium]|jgi:hypothetical protein|nr:hypothetical protein [Acidimicrobiales bacterium]
MKRTWGKLGGQLGLGCCAIGLLAIGLAWNGAAGIDFVSGQIPYLLSGGAFGLALVVIGMGLVAVQNSRRDRAILQNQLSELSTAVNRLANAVGAGGAGTNGGGASYGAPAAQAVAPGMVVVGSTSFHRPDCRLAQGKNLGVMPVEAAEAEGLSPCRICNPTADDGAVELAEDRTRRATRRRTRTSR